MKRPQSHQIDELAQRYFRECLPATWIVNEQHRDYGKDYLVEISNAEGKLTGISFYVQLKGTKKVSAVKSDHIISFSLESKYAHYYHDQVRDIPLILVLVDVVKKNAWWIFLQKTLRDDSRWKHQKSLSLRIPLANTLDDTDRLTDGVYIAIEWMRNNYIDFRTPFLRECFDYLCKTHGLPEAHVLDDGMVEHMNILYFPENPSGIPYFDEQEKEWEFGGNDYDPINVTTSFDGYIEVSTADECAFQLEAYIKNPEEIGEFFYLLENVNEDNVNTNNQKSVSWSELVNSLSILIPSHDGYVTAPLSRLSELHPKAHEVVDTLLDNSPEAWQRRMKLGIGDWDEWCRQYNIGSGLVDDIFPTDEICIYSNRTNVMTYRRWRILGRDYRFGELPIALTRNKDKASLMWFCDKLNSSSHLPNIIRHLLFGEQHNSNVTTVELPSSILEQVRRCIELRNAEKHTK